jgi:hypothetical protein
MTVELFDLALELDEERLQERNGRTLADEDLGRGWLGARVACGLADVERSLPDDNGRQRVVIVLRCIVHPNASCVVARFEMTASLSPSAELCIVGMQPQSALECYRLTEKFTREAGLGTVAVPFSAKAAEERAADMQVRSWTVSASGINTARAKWSFAEHPQAPIPPEHALIIELDSRVNRQAIDAEFYITADIRREGRVSAIPWFGRRQVSMALTPVV